jgi:hypothetical protein
MENTAGPSIFKTATADLSQSAGQISKNPGNWFKRNLIKIVITALIIGVLLEIYFGAHSLFSPSQSQNFSLPFQSASEAKGARLSLVPDKVDYKKGDTVIIDVRLFTGGYTTDSTDLVVKYDPSSLQASGKDFAQVGNIYSEYPAVQVDEKSGMIGISGITLPGKNSFSGTGSFVKLNFKALKDGQTPVTIEYQPESTADSNVVLSGSTQDVLASVSNTEITISPTASSQEFVSKGQSCESFTQSCLDGNGKTGTQGCTGGTMKDGSCGYDPVLTTSCEVCDIK